MQIEEMSDVVLLSELKATPQRIKLAKAKIDTLQKQIDEVKAEIDGYLDDYSAMILGALDRGITVNTVEPEDLP